MAGTLMIKLNSRPVGIVLFCVVRHFETYHLWQPMQICIYIYIFITYIPNPIHRTLLIIIEMLFWLRINKDWWFMLTWWIVEQWVPYLLSPISLSLWWRHHLLWRRDDAGRTLWLFRRLDINQLMCVPHHFEILYTDIHLTSHRVLLSKF